MDFLIEEIPFYYDRPNFFYNIFQCWGLNLSRHYHNHAPNPSNCIELPKSLKLDEGYEKLKQAWKIELVSSEPNFLRALWSVYKWPFISSNLPVVIFNNCNVLTSLMIYYIVKYVNSDEPLYFFVIYIIVYWICSVAYTLAFNNYLLEFQS